MAEVRPVARSPIEPTRPVAVVDGWEVSQVRSDAPLRLADLTPLTKVLVRATPDTRFGVAFGRAQHDEGALIVGSAPGEWYLFSAPGTADDVMGRVDRSGFTTALDQTHGRALVRLSGADAPRVLAKVCSIDLAEPMAPNGAAFRASVAKLVTDVIRDDSPQDAGGERSYLLHCERSSGQYLFDALLDAGAEFGIEVDGFPES